MDLKKISVVIEADGFRLHDKRSGIESGTALEARYEVSVGWVTKDIEFEPDPPTLFHPFRRAMFVYTGEQPSRVLVRRAGSRNPFEEISDRAAFYQRGNFSSYPDFYDPIWDRGGYSDFFFASEAPPPPPPEQFIPSAPEISGEMQDASPNVPPPPMPILEEPEPAAEAAPKAEAAADSTPEAVAADADAGPCEPNAY